MPRPLISNRKTSKTSKAKVRSRTTRSQRTRSTRVDLHTHTNASDGESSPEELVALARKRHVSVLALTDHDTTAGIERAMQAVRAAGDIEFIPGVELSCDVPGAEVHMLGYFIEWQLPELQVMLEKFREGRFGRAQKMVEKLNELGVPVTFERVQNIAGDASIGRPHVAQALLEIGAVQDVKEAFDKYIGRNGPAYFERYRLTPEDAIALILQARGVPVLAHPENVLEYVPALVQAGLAGLEVWYAQYDQRFQGQLNEIAKEHGLIATGGSDFHGLHKMGHMSALGQAPVPTSVVAKLKRKKIEIERISRKE